MPDVVPSPGLAVTAQGAIVIVAYRLDEPSPRLLRIGLDGVVGREVVPPPGAGTPLLAPARDGSVLVVSGDGRRIHTSRVRPDGEMDPAYGAVAATGPGLPTPAAVAVDRAGRILVAGTDYSRGDARFGLARLTAAGLTDRRFGHRGTRIVNAGRSTRSFATSLAVDPRGRTATIGGAASDEGGEIREDYGTRRFAFARFRLR
jgi:hypothetical protein